MGGDPVPLRLAGEGQLRPRWARAPDGAPAVSDIIVLVVDDELLVRDFVQTALEEDGYSVVTASDGRAALSMLEARSDAIRVLVTDVALGRGPSGWDVARRAREIYPDLAVIYVSGGEQHDFGPQRVPNSRLLAKPFGVTQILAAVSIQLTFGDRADGAA